MRVDNRFKVLPYCCFNADLCEEYLGHNGYFENDIEDFKCMDLCKYGTLEKIYCDKAQKHLFFSADPLTQLSVLLPSVPIPP